MNEGLAWDIFVSYCIGNRKYHTADTVRALGWALNQLRNPMNVRKFSWNRYMIRTVAVLWLLLALCH